MSADVRAPLIRLSASLAALAALAFVGRLVVAAGTVTLHVDDSSTCTTGCGTPAAPFRTIAAAISDADTRIVAGSASGATIQVAAGNYPERIYILPNIHVICDSPATTTIDATGTGHSTVVLAGGSSGRVRTDFSIRNCRITGGTGELRAGATRMSGGGVFVLGDAVVSNNIITGNILAGSAPNWIGGGVYLGYGDPVVIGNVITGNVANPPPLSGGSNDSLGIGGGIHVEGNGIGMVVTHARVEANTIADNVAQGEVGKGGGIRVDGADGTLVTRNLIFGNRSNYGGGGIMVYGHVTLADNLVYGNSSTQFGGGMNFYQATARVINNTIFGNSLTLTSAPSGYAYANYGGAMMADALIATSGDVLVSNNLIAGNTVTPAGSTGGLHSHISSPLITYTDFWNNLKLPSTVDHVGGDFVEAQVIGVNNNTAVDPRFTHPPLFADVSVAVGTTTTVAVLMASRYLVNQVLEINNDGVARTITAVNTTTNRLTFTPALPAPSQAFKILANWGSSTDTTEDFRLQPTSPVIDAGNNLPAEGVAVSPRDFDDQPRIQDGNDDNIPTVDLGAYEFMVPDADGDGVPNSQDCAPSVNSVQALPGTIGPTLRLLPGASSPVRWTKILQANVFNVYRGTIEGAFAFNHLCLEGGSPDLLSADSANPPIGTAYYYLVSGVNACGEGCLGLVEPPGACEVPNPSPCAPQMSDSDGDSIQNLNDNCPLAPNATQVDGDRDGVGNACDNCPADTNPDQVDANGDGIGNVCQDFDADGYKASVDCNDLDPSVHPGAIEACNGVDDDCNAAIDDNLGSTTCGTGACSRTVNNCIGGVPQTCTPGTPTSETCNSIDDDCDGAVDDNLGTVTCGVGACTRTASSCIGGVPQNCTPGSPTTETCNGIDDDCDGATDESLGSTSCGTGACSRTVNNCVGGIPQTCTPGTPTAETCNGIDDDCDGSVDESLGSTTCGTGACSRTVNNCVGGIPQTCTPGTPTAETCNGLDDDCDAAVDENLGSTTCGTGACSRTVNNCVGGAPQTCTPGTPEAETCNAIDDDCDAAVDENFDVDGDGFTTCAGDCNDLVAAIRPGAPELCNGTDDNCNLAVDEGFPDSDTDGSADCVDSDDDNDLVADAADCAPLVNSVSAIPGEVGPTLKPVLGGQPGNFTWTRIAQANVHNVYRSTWNHVTGSWSDTLACLVPESAGSSVNDSANPPRGSAFFYVITATNRCGEGTAGFASDGQPRSIPASCAPQARDTDLDSIRDIDDDCPLVANAGQVDRDHDGRGDVCDNCLDTSNPGQDDADTNGLGDACQDVDHDGYSALVDCNDIDPTVHPGASESCNARDDDCNGAVDDNLGTTTCGVGACSRTVNNCAGGVTQTCTPGTPIAEICNGADDDCDGSTDEGFGTTFCGVGACFRAVNNCSGGQVQQCVPGSPAAEACNGLDDDCDGATDEGFLDTDGDTLADCADPDDDGDEVSDVSDNCPLIVNAGQQNLDGDSLGDACDSDADGDTFNLTASGAPIQTLATSELRVEGTQTGTLASVQSADGLYEAIKEVKINNISVLDMRWTFSVPPGHLAMVYVEAYQSANSESDNYQFSWSTDGTNFTNGVIVRKTADDNLPQYFALPLLTSGTVTIRVRDTNRSTGTGLDTVFVDQIRIITSDPADCDDRAASTNPSLNEGPPGAPTCSDLKDNNCDGRIDAIDANCR